MTHIGRWIGLDPGLSGAVAILRGDGALEKVVDLPSLNGEVDIQSLRSVLTSWDNALELGDFVVIEQQQAFPKQGVVSSFKTGMNYGKLLGFLDTLGAKYVVVRASTWKPKVHQPKDKGGVLLNARKRWPEAPLSRAKDEGRAHALWIAEYGRTVIGNSQSER